MLLDTGKTKNELKCRNLLQHMPKVMLFTDNPVKEKLQISVNNFIPLQRENNFFQNLKLCNFLVTIQQEKNAIKAVF